ncbi:helix-turn-helix domain-containing protein [Ascidiimonas sp. W6]|uniref:helix-turn-helix domain-containing protein n=1 Tax=Ascidiimonas meishanensis TaxID=3128903 RepID=UPI0030EEAF78
MFTDFTILDMVLVLGVSQGLFLAISLVVIHKSNQSANSVLAFILLIAAIMLFGRIAAFRVPASLVWRYGIFADTIIFLFGPFVYLYVRRLVYKETPEYRLPLWHYTPAVLHIIFFLGSLTFSLEEFQVKYDEGWLKKIFFIIEAGGILSFWIYGLVLFSFLVNYKKDTKKVVSFMPQMLNFLFLFIVVWLCINLIWMGSFVSQHFFQIEIPFINYSTLWMLIPVLIYLVGFYSLQQPALFRIENFPKENKSERERLKPEERALLCKRLEFYMKNEKIFRQPDLTLAALARKLDTSTNNLSWLLNKVYKSNFYDYINGYRVAQFVEELEKGTHVNHTLLAIAMDAGFNSKSTFNKVFKSLKGTTPSMFVKNYRIQKV